MKKFNLFSIVFLALFLLLFSDSTVAQVDLDVNKFGGTSLLVQFPSTNIDSVETVYSEVFSPAEFDESVTTYYYGRLLTSASGKPRITTVLQGSFDQSNWFAVDTVSVVADSTETYGNGTLNLNSKKVPYLRFSVTGAATNRSDTYVKYAIYNAYKED